MIGRDSIKGHTMNSSHLG